MQDTALQGFKWVMLY